MCMAALPFAVVAGGALKATGLKIICPLYKILANSMRQY